MWTGVSTRVPCLKFFLKNKQTNKQTKKTLYLISFLSFCLLSLNSFFCFFLTMCLSYVCLLADFLEEKKKKRSKQINKIQKQPQDDGFVISIHSSYTFSYASRHILSKLTGYEPCRERAGNQRPQSAPGGNRVFAPRLRLPAVHVIKHAAFPPFTSSSLVNQLAALIRRHASPQAAGTSLHILSHQKNAGPYMLLPLPPRRPFFFSSMICCNQ